MDPPARIGALSNDERWSYIVESMATLIAEGDRMARGLPIVPFRRLSATEQGPYRRAALMAVIPIAYPGYVEEAQLAAIHRACEVYQGNGEDAVPRWLAVRMTTAWQAWGFTYLDAALDGTLDQRIVTDRANTLRLLLASKTETKGGAM